MIREKAQPEKQKSERRKASPAPLTIDERRDRNTHNLLRAFKLLLEESRLEGQTRT